MISAISSAPLLPALLPIKPSICNIPAACAGFTDLLGHPVASYYTTVTATTVSGINTGPAAYNSLLNSVAREQTEGFWSTEQAESNLDVGHYQTVSATADKKFDDDIDVKLLGAYHWFDSTGQAISRGLPYVANIYLYQIPKYQSWQSELTVTGNEFDNRLKWTGGLFFFEESDPKDGGFQYLFLPSAGAPPSAVSGKQITVTNSSSNGELNISYAGYAQATYAILPDTRVTAGVRYSVDQRDAYLGTQTVRTPATAATNAAVVGAAPSIPPAIRLMGSPTPARPMSVHLPRRPARRCRRGNAVPPSARPSTSRHGPSPSITTCLTRRWSISPRVPAIARGLSIPGRSIRWSASPSRKR